MHPTSSQADSAYGTRHRWYVLALLLGAYACHVLDRSILNILFEPIKHEFGLSDGQLGMLSGLAYGLPFALAGLPLGMLADRVNRRKLLALLLSVWSGLTILSGTAGSYMGLLLARLGVGAAEAGCPPSALSLISDTFPPNKRATAIGVFYLGIPLGVLAGFTVGGLVAARFGWRSAFFVAGIPGITLAALILFTLREPQRESSGGGDAVPSLRTTLGFALRQKTVLHMMLVLIIASMVSTAMAAWLSSYLIRFHAFSLKEAGLAMALGVGLMGMLGTGSGGPIADRLSRRAPEWQALFPAVSILLATILGGAMLLAPNPRLAIALLCLWAIFNAAWYGPLYALVVSLVKPRMRGTIVATVTLMSNLIGGTMGPQIVGSLSDLMAPSLGSQSLRYALLIMVSLNVWTVAHCLLGAQCIAADRRRLESI